MIPVMLGDNFMKMQQQQKKKSFILIINNQPDVGKKYLVKAI